MKGKVAPIKSATKAYVLFCFSLFVVVSPGLLFYLLVKTFVKNINDGKDKR